MPGHLEELYGIEVSPDLISAITDAVLDEVAEWQNRPLDICYPLVFFDAIRVQGPRRRLRAQQGRSTSRSGSAGRHKEILGIWIEQTEGAKFWLRVVNELKTGVQDILIAVVDGLKELSRAINAVFPEPSFKLASVTSSATRWILPPGRVTEPGAGAADRLPRGRRCSWPGRPRRLRARPWGAKYPAIAQSWRRNWELVIPFFAFPQGVRRIIYTTNAIEALNSKLHAAPLGPEAIFPLTTQRPSCYLWS